MNPFLKAILYYLFAIILLIGLLLVCGHLHAEGTNAVTPFVISGTATPLPAQPFSQWWTAGGAIIVWRWLKFEIPSAFSWLQDYCNAHDGGLVEVIFHKIFGKPKPPQT